MHKNNQGEKGPFLTTKMMVWHPGAYDLKLAVKQLCWLLQSGQKQKLGFVCKMHRYDLGALYEANICNAKGPILQSHFSDHKHALENLQLSPINVIDF